VTGRREEGPHPDALTDVLAEVTRDEPELTVALEAVPAALDPVEVPAGAWGRLSAALAARDEAVTGSPAPLEGASIASGPRATPTPGAGARPGWNWSHPFTWLTAAVVAGVVLGLGTWGALQAGARARLVDEQRVLSYWMAHPDLKMVALQEVGASAGGDAATPSGRMGVVCILPDGRALLLQPSPAGRGQSYVVVGRGASAGGTERDLAVGRGNVIRFDLQGAERVIVMLAGSDGQRETIAWADVD